MIEKHECAENVNFNLTVQFFGDSNIKYLEVSGKCEKCERKLQFRGRFGLNPAFPTVSIDGSEAVFPFLFDGEEYDGKAHGYSVGVTAAN